METLLKGIGIGFAVAAPVGPIGILCIRRTLKEGCIAGLAAGMGAASADAVYGIMVAGGLAATGLLLNHAAALQLGGGFLIFILGCLSIRAFISKSGEGLDKSEPGGGSWFGTYTTTFVLTLSNPMTILAFVGMVAGLGASSAGNRFAPYWLVGGVFIGSALWWLFLVHAALAARGRLTTSMARWLDIISGTVLVVWGLWIMARAI